MCVDFAPLTTESILRKSPFYEAWRLRLVAIGAAIFQRAQIKIIKHTHHIHNQILLSVQFGSVLFSSQVSRPNRQHPYKDPTIFVYSIDILRIYLWRYTHTLEMEMGLGPVTDREPLRFRTRCPQSLLLTRVCMYSFVGNHLAVSYSLHVYR